jgi:peptidoglycan/xylan/chitin deacetylase (PgdA/CDA1 family)
MSAELTIVGWHNVEGTSCFPSRPGAGTRGLFQQLRAIKLTANVVDLASAVRDLHDGRPLPPRAIALTFDDGYRDNLTQAVPMLRSLGLRATFFLVPGLLDGEPLAWWESIAAALRSSHQPSVHWYGKSYDLRNGDRDIAVDEISASLKRMDQHQRRAEVNGLVARLACADETGLGHTFLDWDDARELAHSGNAIGSHGLDHAILRNEDPAAQLENLTVSKSALERELSVPVTTLAYPNGSAEDFDMSTVASAAAAGYEAALTTIEGWNSPSTPRFQLCRFVLFPERGVRSVVRLAAQWCGHRLAPAPAPSLPSSGRP